MQQKRRLLLAAALLTGACGRVQAAASRPALPLPPSGSRHFDVSLGDHGSGPRVAGIEYRLEWIEGGRYRLNTVAQAVGVIALLYSGQLIQSSEGAIGATGFLPALYSERRGKRPERTIRLDQAGGRMIGVDGEEVAISNGTQDRLSMIFQLGLMLRADPERARAGSRFTVPLASMRRVAQAVIRCAGEAPLTIRGEVVPAIKIELREDPPKGADRIDAWLAPGQSMLPVRIRFEEEDGKIVDQVLAAKAG